MSPAPPRLPPLAPAAVPVLSPSDFGKLRALIETRLGIQMPESKRPMLETRLMRRLRELNFESFREYCHFLEFAPAGSKETSRFMDLVTTNKTSFFRESPQLDLLRSEFLPRILASTTSSGRALRVWSAACSTGQEVWTLAMLFDDARARLCPSTEYLVLGSDVSGRVLRTAVAAKYPEEELDDVPPQFRTRYFMRSKCADDAVVRLTPELRQHAGFFRQNLMASDYRPGESVDLLFLRNTLIYFSRERQVEIVTRATRHLRPGGLFVVGLTESLHGFPLPLTHLGSSIYRLESA